MIHELRTYTLVPERAAEYLALTRDVGYAIRTKHSKCLAYWTTEMGRLNQVVHLWEYENFAHRTRVRAAMAQDQAWATQYLAKSRPCLQRQESMVLMPTDVGPFTPPSGSGIYELRSYRMHPGKAPEWVQEYRAGVEVRRKYGNAPVGIWISEIGELNRVVHLWWYPDLDSRMETRKQFGADSGWQALVAKLNPLIQIMETKILIPTAFSPLK